MFKKLLLPGIGSALVLALSLSVSPATAAGGGEMHRMTTKDAAVENNVAGANHLSSTRLRSLR